MAEAAMAETGMTGAEEEARSAIGTLIAQLITLVRNIVSWVLRYVQQIISWMAEHPLASVLLASNIVILIS